MLAYIVSSVRLLLKLRSNWADYQSQTLPKSWHKMVQVMGATLLVTLLQVVSAFGHPIGDRISIGDIAFILYVGYFILLAIQTAIDNSLHHIYSDVIHSAVGEEHFGAALTPAQKASTQEELNEACTAIRSQVLGQRLHLQSDLTLRTLAEALNMTPHKLSISINNGLGITFYEFINDLRCRYAAQALIDFPQKSITEVLFEAGFTAKSTFYHHFKKVHGMTPSQFRASSISV